MQNPCQPCFNSDVSIWPPALRLMSAHQPCESSDDETQCHRGRKYWQADRDTSSSTCCHRTNAFNLLNTTGTKGIGHADSLQERLHRTGVTQGMEEDRKTEITDTPKSIQWSWRGRRCTMKYNLSEVDTHFYYAGSCMGRLILSVSDINFILSHFFPDI